MGDMEFNGDPLWTLKEAKPSGLVDSGERREYATGAQREPGKELERFDLIPYEPLRQLAVIYGQGALKYADRNWQKGLPLSSFLNSAQRHLSKLHEQRTDENHAAMAAWNMFGYAWTLHEILGGRLPASLDDVGALKSVGDAKS